MNQKTSKPFAARFQGFMIVMLIISLFLVGQQFSKVVYQIGLVTLIISTFLQIGASNLDPKMDFKESSKVMGTALAIVAVVFALGVYLVPIFLHMGKR